MAPRFEELIERHHDEIFSYVWRFLARQRRPDARAEVEDVVQEVFLRAYRAFPGLRRDSNYRAWLYRIATNCALTELRRLKRRRDHADALRALAPCPSGGDPSDRRSHLSTLVEKLPLKQKICVTLRYLEDFDYAEIAELLRCTEAAARANVHQGLRRLREGLEESR